ncbi:MAG: hypothetical protein M1482_10900 [Chloroflexi bacterium]|nr:hypothetical protein [Chloroflexota bacterium]
MSVSLVVGDLDGPVTLRDGDGTEKTFGRNADGTYNAPPGTYDTLVKNGDGSFTLTHADQSQHLFDSSGHLSQIRDRKGNAIAFSYSGDKLTFVQAAGGQTLALTYTGDLLLLSAMRWDTLMTTAILETRLRALRTRSPRPRNSVIRAAV